MEIKLKRFRKKYIDSPLSAGFACIYIPSESLYLEITTHTNVEKELWISRVQSSTKVTFMGPSTFAAYCSALLLGFNSIEVDQKVYAPLNVYLSDGNGSFEEQMNIYKSGNPPKHPFAYRTIAADFNKTLGGFLDNG